MSLLSKNIHTSKVKFSSVTSIDNQPIASYVENKKGDVDILIAKA